MPGVAVAGLRVGGTKVGSPSGLIARIGELGIGQKAQQERVDPGLVGGIERIERVVLRLGREGEELDVRDDAHVRHTTTRGVG